MHIATSVDKSTLPVSLALLKAMCIVASDITDYDALITAYAKTLGDRIEEECSVCVWPQTRKMSFGPNAWDFSSLSGSPIRRVNRKCLEFYGTNYEVTSVTYQTQELEELELPSPPSGDDDPLPDPTINSFGHLIAHIDPSLLISSEPDCWTAIYTVEPLNQDRLVEVYTSVIPIMFNDPQGLKTSDRISGALASLFRGI